MKFDKMPIAGPREGDKPAMLEAIDRLIVLGLDVRRPNCYQLKVTEYISYYPSKRTIFVDEESSIRPERGIDALVELLLKTGDVDPKVLEQLPTEISLED